MATRTRAPKPQADIPATAVRPQVAPRSLSLNLMPGTGPTKRVYQLNPILLTKYPANPFYNGYLTGLIDEILDMDCELQGIIAQRITPVTSGKWDIEPGADNVQGELCAAFVQAAFDNLATADGDQGIRRDVGELMSGIFSGYAGSEVQWQTGPFRFPRPGSQRGWISKPEAWTPRMILQRNRADIGFQADTGLPLRVQRDHPAFGELWPDMTLMLFRPHARYEDPFGYGKFIPVYWLAYFKRYLIELSLRDAEYTSTPAVVFELPPEGMSDNDIGLLEKALKNIHRQSGAILPAGVKAILLQALRGSVREAYEWLIQMCNTGMARCILGQSSTSISGEQRGDIAQAEVHERVAQEIRQEDAWAVEALINNSIVKWLIDLNFTPDQRIYPTLCINVTHVKDLMQRSVVDQAVNLMATAGGYRLTSEYIEDTYGVELEEIPPEQLMAMAPTQQQPGADTRPASDKGDNPRKPKMPNNPSARGQQKANAANNQ